MSKNKLKTKKAAIKRFQVTGNKKKKKYLERSCPQDHFNARERGAKTTSKRLDKKVSKTYRHHIKRLLPYS